MVKMVVMLDLWCWNEVPVQAHQEAPSANAVDDHSVVHLRSITCVPTRKGERKKFTLKSCM